MPVLKSYMDKAQALQIMERLVAANIEAKLEYNPKQGLVEFNNYFVSVTPKDARRAREALHATSETGVEPDLEPEEESEVTGDSEEGVVDKGIFSCPRCGSAKYEHRDEFGQFLLFVILTLITCGLFLPVWFWLLRRNKFSADLRCKSCRHTWRENGASPAT